MTTFNTMKEAKEYASKQKKGFREQIKRAKNSPWYSNSPKRLKERKNFLLESIKTVKVKKVKLKHWNKALYEVVGR